MKDLVKMMYVVFTFGILLSCAPQGQDSPQVNSSDVNLQGQSAVDDGLSQKNILQIAIGSKDHSTLVAAVQAAELENVLVNAGPLTVFAPTNEAFAALPEGTLDDLLKPENKATLARIIKFHAAPGGYDANNIRGVMGIGQATGDKVKVVTEDGVTTVDGGKILGTVKASNGFVHVIDKVLLPPQK